MLSKRSYNLGFYDFSPNSTIVSLSKWKMQSFVVVVESIDKICETQTCLYCHE